MSTRLRPAAVAGIFYPASQERLRRELAVLLASDGSEDRAEDTEPCPKALIVPHAGYLYSGLVAARAFSMLSAYSQTIRHVVLLGPAHHVALRTLALPDCEAFATPLGQVPLDTADIKALHVLPQITVNPEAHRQEHSLEVEIPFLQTVLDEFSLLPLAVGAAPEAVAEVLDHLWGTDETLIVVSSDLSHYLPYADAVRVDAETAHQIEALDPVIKTSQACGAASINGLLLAAARRGLPVRRLDLRNSGDTAGDRRKVVGYGAFAFFETEHEEARHVH